MIIGHCPMCKREMWDDGSCNDHHFTPKSQGGKETTTIHKVCHSKIHSLFTEKELADYYNTPERLLEHEGMQKFVKWVSKKEPNFYERSKRSNRKPKRR